MHRHLRSLAGRRCVTTTKPGAKETWIQSLTGRTSRPGWEMTCQWHTRISQNGKLTGNANAVRSRVFLRCINGVASYNHQQETFNNTQQRVKGNWRRNDKITVMGMTIQHLVTRFPLLHTDHVCLNHQSSSGHHYSPLS